MVQAHRVHMLAVLSLAVLGCQSSPGPRTHNSNAPAEHLLAIALRPQETNMWCWAASGEMIMDFLGTDVSQCDQANRRFGTSEACSNPDKWAYGGWPQFENYGFSKKKTANQALTREQIREQIYKKRKPFAFAWHWDGGGGHMMVVSGYKIIDGTMYLTVLDPWPPGQGQVKPMTVPYDAYVAGPGYSHWDDYYDVTKRR